MDKTKSYENVFEEKGVYGRISLFIDTREKKK